MHRLALKIALVVVLFSGLAGWLFSTMSAAPPVFAGLTALGSGIMAYGAAERLLNRRMKHVESVLNELYEEGTRKERPISPHGDELDRLVHRSDQALHVVQQRVAELNRAESYRRDYVGDVSHEIKTPLFAIHGFAETLLGGALDDAGVNRGFVQKILRHANRLNALANDLSEISRLESGVQKLSTSPFTVRSLLEEVRDSLEMASRQKGIDVQIAVSDGAEQVRGDRERIRQVLTNLVDNAINYTNQGGWVKLHADLERADAVRLSVEDNGIGIEPDDINRVTERFYRAERSRSRSQGGTGLGLSIVKHILAAHGAALRIESRVGEGSTFSFTLPVATGELA